MTPDEIGKILAETANRDFPQSADEAAMERAKGAILGDLHPVRALSSPQVLMLVLVAVFSTFAVTSAALLGMHGLNVLSPMQRALIFGALVGTAGLAAAACVREMRPAAGPRLDTVALAVAVTGFPILFAILFQDYGSRDLIKEGLPCLEAGMCVAMPTGLLLAWILRRGFVLKWSAAGTAAGALSGLAGLGMLELHCDNLKAIHVMIWHVAVVLVSGLLGFLFGRFADSRE